MALIFCFSSSYDEGFYGYGMEFALWDQMENAAIEDTIPQVYTKNTIQQNRK